VPATTRRWLIVLALFVVTSAISVPLAAYGVFLPVLAETFGWTRGAISTALSINLLLGGVAGFALGALADRHGPRVVLVVTVVMAGVAFGCVSTVSALWQLYLLVGVMGGVGMSTFYLLSASTVARWFEERRSLALALVLIGFNVAYISAGPLAAWLIAHVGWRAAYALLGGGGGLIAMLAALTVRLPRPEEAKAIRGGGAAAGAHAMSGGSVSAPVVSVTLGQALADVRQWVLNLSWLLLGGLTFMINVHIVPFARDQGISLAAASLALTAYGLGSMTGRLTAGALSDRVGALTTLRAGYVVQLLGLLALLWAPSYQALLLALAVFGAGFAATDTMFVKAIPDVFGMGALGAIMGILSLGWRSGAAAGPAAAGFLYDLTGSYAVSFGAAPIIVLASWALFAVASSRRRRPSS
jgi:MFS family permease